MNKNDNLSEKLLLNRIFIVTVLDQCAYLSKMLNAPKNILSAILFILLLIYLVKYVKNKKKLYFFSRDNIWIFFLSFFFISLIISSFISIDTKYSLTMIFKHYRDPLLICAGYMISFQRESQARFLIYALAITSVLSGTHFYFEAVERYGTFFLISNEFSINRNFSYTLPVLLPFLFASFFLIKKGVFKFFIITLIIYEIYLGLLTGRRAGFMSIGLEALSFVYLYLKELLRGSTKRKSIIIIVAIAFSVLGMFLAAYQTDNFRNALKRGISPNGRDIIYQDRLHVIKPYFTFGAGHGHKIYDMIMEKNSVPKRVGRKKADGSFEYFNDEGTYVQILFQAGVLAFASYIFFLFFIIYNAWRIEFLPIEPIKLLLFSITIMTIDQYVLRAFVETFTLAKFLPFFVLFAKGLEIIKRGKS